jgi:hypothetical protein
MEVCDNCGYTEPKPLPGVLYRTFFYTQFCNMCGGKVVICAYCTVRKSVICKSCERDNNIDKIIGE